MDLVSAHDKTKVIVLTSHCNKKGEPKIVKKCHHPITGSKCVDKIITELAVFDVCPEIGLTLVEIAEGVSLEDIKKKTGAPFKISDKVKMNAF